MLYFRIANNIQQTNMASKLIKILLRNFHYYFVKHLKFSMIKQTNSIQNLNQKNICSLKSQTCPCKAEQTKGNFQVYQKVEPKILETKQTRRWQICGKKQGQWTYFQIKKMFKLYAEYGSQWKIIETQFPQKTSNMIKNRFYTTVRAFLKILFRQHPNFKNKLPHQIPSKVILKFFQGRQEFVKFKGFGKKILKNIGYNIESKQLKNIVLDHLQEIQILYELIFGQKKTVTAQKETQQDYVQQNVKKQFTEKQVNNNIKDYQEKNKLCKSNKNYEQKYQVLQSKICQQTQVINMNPLQKIQLPQINFIAIPGSNYLTFVNFQPCSAYF